MDLPNNITSTAETVDMSDQEMYSFNDNDSYTGGFGDNDTANSSDIGLEDTYPDPFKHLEVKAIFITLYGLVFLMCFIGNLMVIVVVLKHRKMRTITNFFLANLAVADLCVGIFCVLPNLSMYLSPEWLWGKAMCKFTFFVQTTSYTASVNILTIISVERFFAILYPLRSKRVATLCLLRLAVIFVWVIACSSGIPYFVLYDTINIHTPTNTVMTYCLVNENYYNKQAYVTCNFLFGYVIPLCLMTVMYSCISTVLWRSSQKTDSVKTGGCASNVVSKSNAAKAKKGTNGADVKHAVLRDTYELNEKRHVSSNDSGSGADEHQNLVESANRRSIATRLLKRMDSTLSEDIDTNDDETETEVDYEDDWPRHKGNDGKSFIEDLKSSFKLKKIPKTNGVKAARPMTVCNTAPVVPPVRGANFYNKRLQFKSRGKQENALVARRRVIRLLLAVILSFTVCVLPYHIRVLWQTWTQPEATFWNILISPITFVIYYLNSGLNPIFYAFLSDRFRQCFIEVVTCSDSRVKRQMSVSNKTVHSVA